MTPVTARLTIRFALLGLAIAAAVGGGWFAYRWFRPNLFDLEVVNDSEVEKLKTVNLTRAAATSEDWPQFRGPHRDGWAPAQKINLDWENHPPKLAWSVPCGGGYSSFAVVNGVAYTMDRQGGNERLIALDAETGATRWTHDTPADYSGMKLGFGHGPRATPTVFDGRIYTVGAVGRFQCLKLLDGAGPPKLLWEKDLPGEFNAALAEWGMACSPLIEGDLVIVQPGGKKGSVAAFDRVIGELRWAAGKDPNGYSSPVVATLGGVRQIVAVTGTSILGIALDGTLLWRHPFETSFKGNIAMPVVAGDYVFVSANYGKGCVCLRVAGTSAEVVYFRPNKLMRTHHSTCVHKDGFVYGFDNDQLKCVNLREGVEVDDWLPPGAAPAVTKGSLILVGETLVGLTQTGTLFAAAADPTDWKPRGVVKNVLEGSECWALPVAVNGRIYLRDAEKIVCYDAR